jgi:YegS/Rv2252/BmrU family lipid kinase
MKHIFVINPKAGKRDVTKEITKSVKNHLTDSDSFLYVTTKPMDARDFVSSYCELHPDEKLRFYSCGGDGTLNEVANGAYGYPNASVACYPSGSGNDFVKYFGKIDDFLNLENLVNGNEVEIDMIKIKDRFVMNVFNIGLDADIAARVKRIKRIPFVSGKGAYILGVVASFFRKLPHYFKIIVDDEVLFEGQGLLSAVSNGICYGGGFYCTPYALSNDGLIDVVAVKKVSRLKFLKLIKFYKRGEHLDNPKLKDYIFYKQGKSVRIESNELLNYAMDGEVENSKSIELKIVPNALKFVVPKHLELRK